MSEEKDDIDRRMTTREGSRRAQLRQALKLTLRERVEAVEGMAEVARRFQEMRAQGKFKTATGLSRVSAFERCRKCFMTSCDAQRCTKQNFPITYDLRSNPPFRQGLTVNLYYRST